MKSHYFDHSLIPWISRLISTNFILFTQCFKYRQSYSNDSKCRLDTIKFVSWQGSAGRFFKSRSWFARTCPITLSHRHRCAERYMLGHQLFVRWTKWQNPSSHRCWRLPSTCWTTVVSVIDVSQCDLIRRKAIDNVESPPFLFLTFGNKIVCFRTVFCSPDTIHIA